MWRDYQAKKKKGSSEIKPRLRLFTALVFLLLAAISFRLYILQIKEGDWYRDLASGQHEISSLLQPERGKILVHARLDGKDQLYPLATNKDFSFLYAVPKDISDPKDMAEKLYNFFDASQVEEDANKQLDDQDQKALDKIIQNIQAKNESDQDKQAEIKAAQDRERILKNGNDQKELRQIAFEHLVKEKHDQIIADYLKKVDKPGDPYEPLRPKMSDQDLLALYAFIASTPDKKIEAKDLERHSQKVVFKDNGQTLNIPGLGFRLVSYRYYPENDLASNILGFVSGGEANGQGRYGLEEFFNEELAGTPGSIKGDRGEGNTVILSGREYVAAKNGSNLVLTMDRNAEFQACKYLKETVDKFKAKGGSVIAVNAKTGAILVMCSLPDFNPNDYRQVKDIKDYNNPALLYQYEPGSVFKVITMSAAIDKGDVSPATTYKDTGEIMINGWPKPIRNSDFSTHGGHGIVDMNTVLEYSLNTGAIFAMKQIGPETFADYVKKFGFGEKTGIELGAESSGNIDNLLRKNIREIDAATASFGQGIAVTPLQMVMSYQAIANGGVLMKPYIVQEIDHSDGTKEKLKPQPLRRVISTQTASTILAMLVNVVESGHAKGAKVPGYYIGGKTGTAQVAVNGEYSSDEYDHTFIGIAPIDDPQIVMLTKIDSPQGALYAESTALPLWHQIADFLLSYYQIPKSRK